MSQPFVSIRAAPSAGDQPPPVGEQAALKKRRAVTVACNSCRSKRVRCDGQRPTCSNCRGLASQCVYRNDADISPESKRVVVEIIQTLSRLSGPDAMRVLTSLATETNAANILSMLRNETRSPTATNVATSGNNDEVFEFAVQNPIAYPLLQATAFPENRDFKLDLSSASSHSEPPLHELRPAANQFFNHQEEASPNLCDARLQNLNISTWTSVHISNETAARCISLYLQTDHPLLGHFDPDLFVSHLVSGKDDYCSPLLVNALLYWACQMYSCVDSQIDELTMPFCTEAERLWKVERDQGRDSVASIAAVELICLGYLGQGRDSVILYYISEASLMGTRMGLFGINDGGTGEEGPIVAEIIGDIENWRAHAAWGVFNWITLMSLFYRQPGIFCPKYPPRLSIPEHRLCNKHNLEQPRRPSVQYMGDTFPQLCRFWYIVHEVSLVYYGDDQQPWGCKGTAQFAEFKFRELLALSSCLAPRLSHGENQPHHVLVLHLWFHAVILDIFQPSMERGQQGSRLRTFSGKFVTANAVWDASISQLKHLIKEYRTRYSSARYTILWHTALIYVTNAIINGKRDMNWYADFLVCLYGYVGLGRSWRVAGCVAKSLLSLALKGGIISGRTATLILRDVQNEKHWIAEDIRATFMVDLKLAISDPNCATVEHLAGQFDTHVVMSDWTRVLDNSEET